MTSPRRGHPAAAAGISAFTLCTVLTPTPRVLATFSIPSPAARCLRMVPSIFLLTLGRTSRTPLARARPSPAFTQLRIVPYSNLMKAPRMWKKTRPAGVVVSEQAHVGGFQVLQGVHQGPQ